MVETPNTPTPDTLIQCTLHGSFEDLLPSNSENNQCALPASAKLSTTADLIAHFGIDPDLVHYVILNGQYLDEDNWQNTLPPNANIRFWPRLAGG